MYVATILLFVFSAIVFMQIIFRSILKVPMMWSIEVSLLCFFWAIFLGGAVALRYRRHYTVEILPEKFVKTNLSLDIISHLFVFILIYLFIIHGFHFASLTFNKMSTSIAMPQGFFYLSLPIGAIAMLLFSIESFVSDCKKLIHLVKEVS